MVQFIGVMTAYLVSKGKRRPWYLQTHTVGVLSFSGAFECFDASKSVRALARADLRWVQGQPACLEVLWYGENSLSLGVPRFEFRRTAKAVSF